MKNPVEVTCNSFTDIAKLAEAMSFQFSKVEATPLTNGAWLAKFHGASDEFVDLCVQRAELDAVCFVRI